jgi:hypothetical protein
MRFRFAALAIALVASLALAGTAFGFDCIRVSSSLKGLQQSTKSGNWLLFDFSSVEGALQTFENIGEDVTEEEATCFVEVYGESGQPVFFALGIGVAGPNGVIAFHNATAAMGDGKGIDHLEASGIFAAFEEAAGQCAES